MCVQKKKSVCSAFNICLPYWTLELGIGWGCTLLLTCGTGSSPRKGGDRNAQEGTGPLLRACVQADQEGFLEEWDPRDGLGLDGREDGE